MCFARVIIASRTSLTTEQPYKRDRVSVWMSITSPYIDRTVRPPPSDTAGGGWEFVLFSSPIPAVLIQTVNISPLLCRYETYPSFEWNTSCLRPMHRNSIHACLKGAHKRTNQASESGWARIPMSQSRPCVEWNPLMHVRGNISEPGSQVKLPEAESRPTLLRVRAL
jgi:hypothetical protein